MFAFKLFIYCMYSSKNNIKLIIIITTSKHRYGTNTAHDTRDLYVLPDLMIMLERTPLNWFWCPAGTAPLYIGLNFRSTLSVDMMPQDSMTMASLVNLVPKLSNNYIKYLQTNIRYWVMLLYILNTTCLRVGAIL